jgi:probable HAF family extracellular repeat protein
MAMQTRDTRLHTLVVIALLVGMAELTCARQTLAQTVAYTVLELSGVENGGQVACALNNFGDAVGRAGDSSRAETRATIWNHNILRPTLLASLFADDHSSARGINDAKEVVGGSNTDTSIVPFIWSASGGMQRVPTLAGDNGGQAFSINKYGHVAGYSSGPRGARAFVWKRGTGVGDLGVLPGGTYSRARDLNDSTEVVGMSASPAGNRAVLWTATGKLSDLGTLPGDTSSEATAINNTGAVVGFSSGPRGTHAFLWTNTTGMQDLGVLSGASSSRALDINDAGTVVGFCGGPSGERAFIWKKDTGMQDLNDAISTTLGVLLLEAHAINNRGQILAMGMDQHNPAMTIEVGGNEHSACAAAPQAAFLLTRISTQ